MIKPISRDDWVVSSSRKGLKGSGLELGQILWVINVTPLPVKKSDPYLQRIHALVLKFNGEFLEVPDEGNDYKAYLVDPRNLTLLSEEDNDKYNAYINENYGKPKTVN